MTVAIAVPPWNGTVDDSKERLRWLTVDPSQVTRLVLGMRSPPAAWAIVRPFAWSTEPASPTAALVTGLPSIALTIGPTYMNTLPYDFIEPEAVSNVVSWLAGDESRYCTGSQFVVDLGNTSR